MAAVPALLFVTVELGLRLAGYGYPTPYLIPWEVEGQPAYVNNSEFGRRFFPPGLERRPHPAVVPAGKEEGTIRVFIMGASATLGDPDSTFSFGRILEVMLEHRYPSARFEVINSSITAINSHVVLPIARDCARHDPDLFVIYLGNNEVVGPFGAGSVLKPFSGNLPVIRAGLAVKRIKIGQLMDSLLYSLGAQAAPKTWYGMEMFIDKQIRHDDPRMEAVYRNFQRNLTDIAEVAADAGARVVFSTLGVNEGDLAPLGSLHAPGLSEAQQATWQERYETGVAFEEAGNWSGAVQGFTEAEAIDGTYAELQFRLGRCARALGRYDKAKKHFALARDLDTLRFRADSRINEIIRTLATELADEGALLADTARVLSEASPNGIPGSEFFHDHVHLTFAGNYQIARTVLEQVARALPDSLATAGLDKGNVLTEEACAKRLALAGSDRAEHLNRMYDRMTRPPFTSRYDHDARMAELRQRREVLRPELTIAGRLKAVAACREVLRTVPQDTWIRYRLAILLLEIGDPAAAEEEVRHVIRRMPHLSQIQNTLVKALIMQKAYDEAEVFCREMLELSPNSADIYRNLGSVLAFKDDIPGAIDVFRAALAIYPFRADLHFSFARTLALRVDPEAAIAEFEATIELEPRHSEAHIGLGGLLIRSGRPKEAVPVLRRAIKQDPSNAKAHLTLGTALWRTNKTKEAFAEFQEAVAIDPGEIIAHGNIARILWSEKDYDGAWAAVRLCRLAGGKLDPKFIARLERDSGRTR